MTELKVQDHPAAPVRQVPPANPLYREPPPPAQRPISVLVGFTEDGSPIYGHVTFDVVPKPGFLTTLGSQLTAMETAVMPKPGKPQNPPSEKK